MNDTMARVAESLFRRELEMREATLNTAYQRLEAAGCFRPDRGDAQPGDRERYYVIIDLGSKRRSGGKNPRRKAKKQTNRLQEG